MLDIHMAPTDAPPLTAHMRAHLVAQYRLDLRRDERELEHLRRLGARTCNSDRVGVLLLRRITTRDAIRDMGGRA